MAVRTAVRAVVLVAAGRAVLVAVRVAVLVAVRVAVLVDVLVAVKVAEGDGVSDVHVAKSVTSPAVSGR